jgi:hypothetical protein
MKLLVGPPELVPDLVCALNETDCLAAQTGVSTVEVLAPWLVEAGDREQTAIELIFFVRAWAVDHPGFRADLLPG